jgi:hypothetical protein
MRQPVLGFDFKLATPIGREHYVPILKSRRAELESLRHLDTSVRDQLRPLLELTRSPSVPETTPPEEYLETLGRKLVQVWGTERPILVDTAYLPMPTKQATYLELFAEMALDLSIQMIPVSGPDRSSDHVAVARHIGRQRGLGFALRVPIPIDGSGTGLENTIQKLASEDGTSPQHCDLIFDFGSIAEEPLLKVARSVRRVLGGLTNPGQWRSLVTAFGGFPLNLSNFRPCTSGTIERKDWQIWSPLASNESGRVPSFGDYAIAHPGLPVAGFAAPLSLRYATGMEWQIIKGAVPGSDDGWFKEACASFVQSPHFSGAGFSSGDRELSERVKQDVIGGNASNWRAIGTSHHMALVASQVRELTRTK